MGRALARQDNSNESTKLDHNPEITSLHLWLIRFFFLFYKRVLFRDDVFLSRGMINTPESMKEKVRKMKYFTFE